MTALSALLAGAFNAHGDRVAIRFPGAPGLNELSYAELDRRSARFRDRIIEAVEPGEFVLLSGQNSIEWVIALVGLIRAGAVPVPLDPELDASDRAAMAEDTQAAGAVADRKLLEELPGAGRLRIALEDVRPLTEAAGVAEPQREDHRAAPDDVAVMLYTAGTMGKPKGVMLTHRNLMANIEGVIEAAGIRPDDSLLVPLPLYHSFPLMVGCLAPLVAGVPVDLESRPTRLATRLRDAHPTLVIGVPALFEAIMRRVRQRSRSGVQGAMLRAALALNRFLISRLGVNAGPLLFSSIQRQLGGRLRYAVSGGAALPAEVVRDAIALGIPLMQGYGLSEASPVVSVQRFDRRRFLFSKDYWDHAGSAGQPLSNLQVRIEPVAAGEPEIGEVMVSGPTVMAGYHHRDEETRQALRDGQLRTGDLGRIDNDGHLWITGRAKLAVSTPAGKLVQLEEIEAALQREPEIGQVLVRERTRPQWELVAAVFPSAALGDVSSEDEVRARVEAGARRASRVLHPQERVDRIELTDAPFPATRLGKVRRDGLPEQCTFDLQRWREHVSAGGGEATGQPAAPERHPAPRAGRTKRPGDSDYRLPAGFVLERLVDVAIRRRRNLGDDGKRLFAGRTPGPVGLDIEHIPAEGSFIVVMNHYEREGLRVWWDAMLVSSALTEVRPNAPVRWLVTDRWYGVRVLGVPVPSHAVSWLLGWVARLYGLIPVPRVLSMTEMRSAALRETYETLRGERGPAQPVGITPEGARGFGPELGEPPPNAALTIAMLSDGRIPVLPVAVYEDEQRRLVARFGVPYTMDWPGLEQARAQRKEMTWRVMRSLAVLLPAELRGPYGEEPGGPQTKSEAS